MRRFTVAYFAAIFAWTASGWAEDSGKLIAERVQKLRADTVWTAVREIPLKFNAHHPQGMAIVDGEFWVSSVEVINRAKGEGHAHLYRIDREGVRLDERSFRGDLRYHPGGIDFDGTHLWMPVAEYRPESTSEIWRIDPKTFQPVLVHYPKPLGDHLGALVYNPESHLLMGASWGSRCFHQWSTRDNGTGALIIEARGPRKENSSHFIDLQDGQWLPGTSLMLCGGLQNYRGPKGNFALGGLELIDMETLIPVHQVPVLVWEPGGRPMTQNAFAAEMTEMRLRFYFLPGDGEATIYVYEPALAEK